MDNLPVLVISDPNIMVKHRIKNILANQEIKIYETSNRQELLQVLAENNNKVDLIITDIEIDMNDSFDGISLIKLVKSKSDAIPVVVLTSTSKKDVITKYLLEGTADYILKPFEDDFLREKLLKYINIENLTEFTVLKFSLRNFLESEIYKAKKGGYNFSLLKISFNMNSDEDPNHSNEGFYKYAKSIYTEIKSMFWESDLYIQHGYQSHLGFFPFCTHENTQVIAKKIHERFENFKIKDPKMKNISIVQSFATYPIDGETTIELLNALALNVSE